MVKQKEPYDRCAQQKCCEELYRSGQVKLHDIPSEVSVLFTGDLCPINSYADCFSAGRPEELMPDLLPVTDAADLHVANLELPLTNRGEPIEKCGPNFRADPRAVCGLRRLNITHACLANNHIGDYGEPGIRDTISVLRENDIKPLGIASGHRAMMEPLFSQHAGVSFCLFNLAEAEFSYPDDDQPGASFLNEPAALEVLQNASEKADVTVVVFHGGRECQYLPPAWTRQMCRRFLAFGADAVIVHHAHVPQGVEILPNGVICYSLGNFVFDIPEHAPYPGTRLGYMVQLGFGSNGLSDLALIPTFKDANCTVSRMEAENAKRFFDFLRTISSPLADESWTRRIWREYVRRDAPGYLSALREHASVLGENPQSMSKRDTKLLYAYLVGCRTHREIMSESVRLLFENDLESDPGAARQIEEWRKAVAGLVRAMESDLPS